MLHLVLMLMLNAPGGETFTLTAYDNCELCCGKKPTDPAYGITASGKRTRWGVVAADWSVLPKGTRIKLSCLRGQTFTVLDTGGAIKGNRIDVWFPTHKAALQFGVKRGVKIEVVKEKVGG